MKKLIPILLLGAAVLPAFAESTEADNTYFHPAASLYVHGDATSASNLVARGLSEFPDDPKLKKLEELLKQQQQQDQQDQQNDEQQNQNDQDQQDQKDQQDKDQQNQDNQNQQDQNGQDDQQDQQSDQQQEQQPQPSAEQMSADEARRLMDAMKQEEKNERLQLHPVMGDPVQVDKDW